MRTRKDLLLKIEKFVKTLDKKSRNHYRKAIADPKSSDWNEEYWYGGSKALEEVLVYLKRIKEVL